WDQVILSVGCIFNSGDLTDDAFDCLFTLPTIDAPFLDPNRRFQDINLLGGGLTAGQSVALHPIGTDTTVNLRFVVPSAFSIAAGATLGVGTGVRFFIREQQAITVAGTFNITSPASFQIEETLNYGTSQGINVTGTMNVTGTSFTRTGNTSDNSQII